MKGWPREKTFDQILILDTVHEHIVFTPFTRADQRMVFRRNPDNTVNLNLLAITLDIHDVEVIRSDEHKAKP